MIMLSFLLHSPATSKIYTLSLHDALPIFRYAKPPNEYVVPVTGIAPKQVKSSWGAPRSGGRSHEGIDILAPRDRKSTRLNSSHLVISYAVFCLKKKNIKNYSLNTNYLQQI